MVNNVETVTVIVLSSKYTRFTPLGGDIYQLYF